MNGKRMVLLGILGTIALFTIAALLLVYYNSNNTAEKGKKKIIIQVIVPGEDVEEFTIFTDAETLRQALDEKNLIKGEDSSYGLLINEVNGRKIDASKQEWWSISKTGEFSMYGVNDIMIQNKVQYELTLMEGY